MNEKVPNIQTGETNPSTDESIEAQKAELLAARKFEEFYKLSESLRTADHPTAAQQNSSHFDAPQVQSRQQG